MAGGMVGRPVPVQCPVDSCYAGGRTTSNRIMTRRYVSIWFRHLKTDWFQNRRPALKNVPFVLAITDHGRKLIAAANRHTEAQGIYAGMTVADARAIIPELEVVDDVP